MDHFTTSRLTAERLHDGHLADLVALHLDAEVSRFIGGVRSAEATKTYLAVNMAHWDRHGFGLWALRTKDGDFAGRAGLRHLDVDGLDEVEIFYAFKRASWGQQLASEIASALTDIAFTRLALPSLVGLVYPDNSASRRVLEKSGFALERSTMRPGGEMVIYRARRAAKS
ncbi:GNAT family N-acetyltransferase [Bradyrhizobium liaoningense]|uniref:GNAT family N-acetyltransferase n=1 Tax=Bradyrhizobium liaoningense TaxID=43992 RepID=UPI001BA9E98B|nr:GNAT family N-acetyltransferase [Bradyrhizobium liaoningense]MBR0717004.1 GNAT family N-acetyltransferase [Bradyrhizobium liaoningense]